MKTDRNLSLMKEEEKLRIITANWSKTLMFHEIQVKQISTAIKLKYFLCDKLKWNIILREN